MMVHWLTVGSLKKKENTEQDHFHNNREMELQVLQIPKTNYDRNINCNCLHSGFTCVDVSIATLAQCVPCQETLRNSSMFPRKITMACTHKHVDWKEKSIAFLKCKCDELNYSQNNPT